MKKKITIPVFLIVCIFSSAVFAADKEKEKITDLTPWKGDNISIVTLYENEAGERFFKEILELLPKGYTKKMVKDSIYDLYYMKLKSLNVMDENTIIIDDKLTGDYIHVCSIGMDLGSHTAAWQVFKTESKEMIQAGFKYILFLPYHQSNKDTLRHAHLRYGNENFDFLTTDPSVKSWWPTIYQPTKTDEAKATAQMTTPRMVKMMAGMMKKRQ
ncbi:hypothetical protein [uncultured Desulfobacter sp.]|uniref:hypothetical protein n=1 Tax=uncultured Desulfobacter sp. TaxID=240139 RepID=UPI002AA70F3D|nr:hypothetical protein [uncultured Desulfobacter sp.]